MRRAALIAASALSLAGCNGAAIDGEEQVVLASPAAAATPQAAATLAAAEAAAVSTPTPATSLDFRDLEGERTQGGWIRGVAAPGATKITLGDAPVTIGDNGTFFAAFDRDAGDHAVLKADFAGGQSITTKIDIAPRKWNIQHVNVAKRGGGSSEAWWKKREPEWLAIKAARAKVTGAQGWKQDFIWPVKGRISGHFGRQRIYRGEPGSYHSGLDIAPGNGVAFVAPADGVVVLARKGFSLEGTLLIIDHGAGLNSAFLHASKLAVGEGEAVKQGQYIGNVGSTGRSTGPHLHWGLKWNDARIDPLLLVGPQ